MWFIRLWNKSTLNNSIIKTNEKSYNDETLNPYDLIGKFKPWHSKQSTIKLIQISRFNTMRTHKWISSNHTNIVGSNNSLSIITPYGNSLHILYILTNFKQVSKWKLSSIMNEVLPLMVGLETKGRTVAKDKSQRNKGKLN